ncbi:MAG: hypothetical protein IT181_13080 [Acidobacteria bacterium]|nr:hypothetical protein [Acidobacteriota bacterium]
MSVSMSSSASAGNAGSPALFDNMATGTLLMLLKLNDVSPGIVRRNWATKLGAALGGFEFHQRVLDGVSFRFAPYKGGAQAAAVSTGILVTGAWIWIGVSWDMNGSGVLLANMWHGVGASRPAMADVTASVSGSGTLDDDSGYNLFLWNNYNLANALDGECAEALLFPTRETTAKAVETMIAGRSDVPPSGLWFPGYDGSDTLAADYSGNGNDLALSGMAVTKPPRLPPWLGGRLALPAIGTPLRPAAFAPGLGR